MWHYLHRLRHRLTNKFLPNLLDSYVASMPHPQNALNIFKGEWVSRLPEPYASLEAGKLALFEDVRIKWAETELSGFQNKSILDLGPLEGAHPHMFERLGAKEIVSIEGDTRAFLKCLITKELLGLKRVSYQCGDSWSISGRIRRGSTSLMRVECSTINSTPLNYSHSSPERQTV